MHLLNVRHEIRKSSFVESVPSGRKRLLTFTEAVLVRCLLLMRVLRSSGEFTCLALIDVKNNHWQSRDVSPWWFSTLETLYYTVLLTLCSHFVYPESLRINFWRVHSFNSSDKQKWYLGNWKSYIFKAYSCIDRLWLPDSVLSFHIALKLRRLLVIIYTIH